MSDVGEAKTPFHELGRAGDEILNVRAEVQSRSGRVQKATHVMGRALSRPAFFVVLLLAHLAWIVLNLGWIPGLTPWDPYPFTALATLASVEAPFISLLILMRQHQDARIDELREEVDLQVALHNEQKVTTLLRVLDAMRRGGDPQVSDDRLDALKQELDPEALMERIRRHLDASQGEETEEGEQRGERS